MNRENSKFKIDNTTLFNRLSGKLHPSNPGEIRVSKDLAGENQNFGGLCLAKAKATNGVCRRGAAFRFKHILTCMTLLTVFLITFYDEIRAEQENRERILLSQLDHSGEESATILIKAFEFIQPFKAGDSEEVIALKERRRQIMEMYDEEKSRYDKASENTKKNIEEHIKYLEKSLGQMDDDIAKHGDTLIPSAALHDITDEFRDRELTLEEMNEVADRVTLAYQEEGYILARAYIPEQEIEEGILKIAIVEGEVGEIRVTGNKYYDERVIKRNFEQQLKHGVIRESLIEEGILLAKELPASETRIVLEKGEKPGTANLALQTEDRFALEWKFDANNFGSEYIGRERYGTSVEITDPWWGSTLSFRGVAGNHRDMSTLGSLELDMPMPEVSTSLNFRYINGLYAIGQNLVDLGLEGETRISGFGIRQPIWRTRNKNLTFSLSRERKKTVNLLMDDVSSVDEVKSYQATLDYDSLDRFLGKNLFSISYHRGNIKQDPIIDLSRAGVSNRFNRTTVNLARIQKIYGNTNIMLRASGQKTHDVLLPIEQLAIGGYGTVRGHETSIFLGDSGYTLSAEIMTAPPFIADKVIFGQRVAQMAQLAAFYDYGEVYNTEHQPGEFYKKRLSGYGAGFRLFYKDLLTLKFDVGLPYSEAIAGEDSRFYYIMGSINFTSSELKPLLKKIFFHDKPSEE
ncbi:MAG: ShlB/FhaC/HecB family hemolysin secretion/activation protein [Deltaproteobacteria bacterium]|nr:ShlB/FhaC/HecB family hemolysin secretion/activation protein [Deltaproteobacteria bacterium]